MAKETYHGVEMDSKWLDDLWLSILNVVPKDKWVDITKNHDQVVAGVKHFIDCACFGQPITLTLSNDLTQFMKNEQPERTTEEVGRKG